MRILTAKWTLVAAGSCVAAATARAQDAQEGPRGSIVFPAGDRVHGFIRGGETHVLEVHLRAGDRYACALAAASAQRGALLHASMRDPQRREINWEARVRHFGSGTRVTVGPFRAAETGTYTLELTGQGGWEGDYAGSSRLRGARRATYVLPRDGGAVEVDVRAGSTLHLRVNGKVPRLLMALPGEPSHEFTGDDPLIAALRGGKLASSETGTYAFAAPDARGSASVAVVSPRWKPQTVEFPTLPEATADAPMQWAGRWVSSVPTPLAPEPTIVGTPVAADGSFGAQSLPTVFTGRDIGIATDRFSSQFAITSQTELPPLPAAGLEFGSEHGDTAESLDWEFAGLRVTENTTFPAFPSLSHTGFLGFPALLGGKDVMRWGVTSGTWRWTPWAKGDSVALPSQAMSRLLPSESYVAEDLTRRSEEQDASVRRVFVVTGGDAVGEIVTTIRCSIAGHSVPSVLATKGAYEIRWSVEGAGVRGAAAWTLKGSWTCVALSPSSSTQWHPRSDANLSVLGPSVLLNGEERYESDGVVETIEARDVTTFYSGCDVWDIRGRITNKLALTSAGFYQTVVREPGPLVPPDYRKTFVITATTRVLPPGSDPSLQPRETTQEVSLSPSWRR